ncbi:HAD family hydrolase [Methanobacterium veterum]|uniref:HAD family hydrolase n=1 Tax=Methanobacterium veterum TaxID=408577 RepID=A0A9E5A2Q4_9EURY|nr:HAD family hydrolase [Methanobacterium veterum]MCZ3366995.1 HAD family hydrolase [Methanobacterium veterum]
MVIEIPGTIFLDLDGTLLDTSPRHYKLYQDILNKRGVSESKVSPEKFWNMKRTGIKTRNILPASFSEEAVISFEEEWLQKIEKKSYLQYDEPFPKTKKVLSCLNNEFDLVLVTLRNNKENLHWELSKLGLQSYFKSIICGKGPKKKLVEDYLRDSPYEKCIIIGDTEEDIKTGLELKITTVSVTWGIRSRAFLEDFNPDFCTDSFQEIIDIINF